MTETASRTAITLCGSLRTGSINETLRRHMSAKLREAGVSGPLLPWALAGFNIGVEAGQLVGVAAWCVLHLALVRWALYDKVVVRGGSWALLALAAYWTVERLTGA